jgi:hypothetical protein
MSIYRYHDYFYDYIKHVEIKNDILINSVKNKTLKESKISLNGNQNLNSIF